MNKNQKYIIFFLTLLVFVIYGYIYVQPFYFWEHGVETRVFDALYVNEPDYKEVGFNIWGGTLECVYENEFLDCRITWRKR